MCAISGIVNTHGIDGVDAILQKMIAAQAHRGPDESGTYIDSDIAFGHARLSVIDPDNGKQPMISRTGSIVLVANGEIYNFKQIKEKLSVRGHRFLTGSDSECIIHMYEEYGDECINHLDGMFAFALFDLRRRKLLLGRDRLGQKPLLYFMSGDTLIFASEFAGLMAHPAFPAELDKRALSDYLSLQYIPQPDTAFLRVRKLPPGHLLTQNLENGNISIRCYWQPDYSLKNSGLSLSAATAELRKLVEKAVEKRLVSDVPLGTFLSGGVDSCIVTGIAAKLLYPAPCDAFTAGFGVAQYDERAAAKESAAVINRFSGGNLRCHEQEIKPDDFDLLEKLSGHFGEPFADASALPFFLLSRFARKHIKVALAGDGADEIFAGYERYLAMRYAEAAYWLPLPVRKALFATAAGMLPDHGERSKSGRLRRLLNLFAAPEKNGYFGLLDRCPAAMKKELFGPAMQSVADHDSASCFAGMNWELVAKDKVEQLGELDLRTYLPGDILVKADIASMANGLELRSPFMDKAVVEFAARLPMKYKLHGKQRKMILKAAFSDLITPELANRPKRGFGVPVAAWLRETWKERACDKLFNSPLLREGYINGGALKNCWELHQSGKRDFSYLLWELIIFAFFLERMEKRSC